MAEEIPGIKEGQEPIDYLRPASPQHEKLLTHLRQRMDYAEERMSSFYPRWRMNELALQAYISLPDYEKMLKSVQEKKNAPSVAVSINVPFAWATINTIVTYLIHMFGGRSPIFQVGSMRGEQVKQAKNMELLLQYNADYKKFIKALYFFLMDGETYGLGVLRTMWTQEKRNKWKLVQPEAEVASLLNAMGQPIRPERVKSSYICFEGNTIENIDPFMFFPDPRVPMTDVSEKGEFVFWRAFEGKHILQKEQAAGRLKWVDTVEVTSGTYNTGVGGNNASARGIRALGEGQPGKETTAGRGYVAQNYQVDQGTIEIVPKDFGLGTSAVPEKWLFTWLNGKQIIQAQPLDSPSDKHPVEVVEPNSVGYSFGNLGTVDMLGPMQDMMSWFMNSHIYNVRASLNNMFVVDPSRVEMGDLANPEPGKIIRLKNTMMPQLNNRPAIEQLQVADVTRGHINDFSMFQRMASDLTGATDNNRGLQEAGGRKTATEVRVSSDAGTSRLAAKGKLYSTMALVGLAEQWCLNYQANMSEAFQVSVLGQNGQMDSVIIDPDNVQGDFYFPVHDGTLPIDKVGMLDIWRQIFLGIAQDPELRQRYDMPAMFNFIAQLGGATNISSFQLQVQPTQDAMQQVDTGAGVPLSQVMETFGGIGGA